MNRPKCPAQWESQWSRHGDGEWPSHHVTEEKSRERQGRTARERYSRFEVYRLAGAKIPEPAPRSTPAPYIKPHPYRHRRRGGRSTRGAQRSPPPPCDLHNGVHRAEAQSQRQGALWGGAHQGGGWVVTPARPHHRRQHPGCRYPVHASSGCGGPDTSPCMPVRARSRPPRRHRHHGTRPHQTAPAWGACTCCPSVGRCDRGRPTSCSRYNSGRKTSALWWRGRERGVRARAPPPPYFFFSYHDAMS